MKCDRLWAVAWLAVAAVCLTQKDRQERKFRSLIRTGECARSGRRSLRLLTGVCIFVSDPGYIQFFGDDFLRLLILRYIFCHVVLHLHRGFKVSSSRRPAGRPGVAEEWPTTDPRFRFQGRQFRPRAQPPLPEGDLLDHPALQHLVFDLAVHLDVRGLFLDSQEMDWSTANGGRDGTAHKPARSIAVFAVTVSLRGRPDRTSIVTRIDYCRVANWAREERPFGCGAGRASQGERRRFPDDAAREIRFGDQGRRTSLPPRRRRLCGARGPRHHLADPPLPVPFYSRLTTEFQLSP